MNSLDDIGRQLPAEEFELSRHAFKRAVEQNIRDAEIVQAGKQSRVGEAKLMKPVQMDVFAYRQPTLIDSMPYEPGNDYA